MTEFFTRLFDPAGFPPRWTCGQWTPFHGWLYIVSDLGIWSAYLAIPCVLAYFAARRRDIPFRPVLVLFVAFIFACGTTHLLDALMFWWPGYRLSAAVRFLTAVVSWATVVALIPVVPQVLALRSPRELEAEIAERRRVEEELRKSLAEQQVLLREVHHRVKNNLQVICSLLDLQMRTLRNPDAAAAFQEAQDRVRSMALVHERLYQTELLSAVELGGYVRDLVGVLRDSYPDRRAAVRFDLDLESVQLGVDAAIPCGLIVNELVCNCLKHAFPDGRDGVVTVRLTGRAGTAALAVSDDGMGTSQAVDLAAPTTFGLRLVAALTAQLHGTVAVEQRDGTTVRVEFPVS